MANTRRPILFKGEVYSAPVIKKGGGGSKPPKTSYDDASVNLRNNIGKVRRDINSLPLHYRTSNEMILCLRLQPEYSAKSYYPDSLFFTGEGGDEFTEIGSRLWRTVGAGDADKAKSVDVERDKNVEKDEKLNTGKLLFIRATNSGLNTFEKALTQLDRTKKFENDVCKVASLNLLSGDEQILGFSDQWKEGRIEAVIHPFMTDRAEALEYFLQIAKEVGAVMDEIKVRQYEGGVTFISMLGNRQLLNALAGYNPLRVVHPLVMRSLPDITRSVTTLGIPNTTAFSGKPTTVLGVLDGGYKSGNTLLDYYIEAVDSVAGQAFAAGEQHGAMVSAASLYGPLNPFNNSDTLPAPAIAVKNFRILSDASAKDHDLYLSIDAIETILPANPNIRVYNLSIGPAGAILDDHISRFTFSCDQLSVKHNVLFCVAVGNDGEIPDNDRIQSPSDIVNGLGVGAFTIDGGKKVPAPYSCKGPGREGNKLKPDLVGFGGCDRFPLQLLSATPGSRSYTSGTSFSSPIIAGIAAQLIGGSNGQINALVARGMIIHSAIENDSRSHCKLMGHGALPDDVSELISCPDKTFTLIYEGEISAATYYQFTIPWENNVVSNGMVSFKWTTVVMTDVDPLSPDDYTGSSVQTTFYPNSKKYKFTNEKQSKTVDLDDDPGMETTLTNQGWIKDAFPVAKSGPTPYEKEASLRSDLKWDSVDHRIKNIRADDVKSPMFHIHAISRGSRTVNAKVKFALILTVEAPKATIDLYSRVKILYPNLLPVNAIVQATVKVG